MRGSRLARNIRDRGEAGARPQRVAGKVAQIDLHLEGGVLGTCLTVEQRRTEALEYVRPEYFWSGPNEWLFRAIVDLSLTGSVVDAISLAAWLKDRGRFEVVGGFEYMKELSNTFAEVHDMRSAGKRLCDLWRMRRVIEVCTRANAEAYADEVDDRSAWIERVEASIYEVAHPVERSEVKHINDVLKVSFDRMVAAAESGQRMRGIPTRYDLLDAMLAGLHDGALTLVAGRPGQGKTSFALNLAVNVASPRKAAVADGATGELRDVDAPGFGVAVFSLEMMKEELGEKMACCEGRVDMERLRTGMAQPDDWRRLTDASQYLSTLPIWIDEQTSTTLLEIRSKLRRIQAQWNRPATDGQPERRIGLVVIDYIQLMKGSGETDSREQEVAEISRGLKQLAKDFKVPVVALSQLNRRVEQRSDKNKRPQLSDLRESGSLEQDADNVLFVHREEYYLGADTPADLKGIAEIIVAKQRNGPTGKVLMRFAKAYTRFDTLQRHEYPDGLCDE
jgi:replicative DNA helicase